MAVVRPPAARARTAFARAALALTPALAGLAAGGCYGRGRAAGPAEEPTAVRVENRNFLDHNVYVVATPGGVRARLGTVPGNTTRLLPIPPSYVQPGALLRFIADPIGGSAAPVSDQIAVRPGDELLLVIPPG